MNRTAREALVLTGAALVIGLGLNGFRPDPLPLSGAIGPPPAPEPGASLRAHTPEEALGSWEEGAFFLDVRSRDAYDGRRIAGAFSFEADRSADRYFDVVAAWGDEIPLFVYGAGQDSFAVRRVAAELIELGHDVGLVVCGLDELLAVGLDFEEGPAEGMP